MENRKELEDLQKAVALERQRINILKNQIDFLIKENKDRILQIYNLGERATKLEEKKIK